VLDAGDGNTGDVGDWRMPDFFDGKRCARIGPTELKATAGNALVTLNWKAGPGASAYNVYLR